MLVTTVVGARPQFIKASVVSHAFQAEGVDEVIVHTGQHFDPNMSDTFFEELGIPKPKHHLNISNLSHGAMTGRMLEQLEAIFMTKRPDWVLVYGDTNSTLAAALAAAKLSIPIAHVEAGLRSFNKAMPEEINRILTDHMAEKLFTPHKDATEQLVKEGVDPGKVQDVGDVMYDVALHFKTRAKPLDLGLDRYVLATVHRQENTDNDQRLEGILEGLITISKTIPVVLPLHPRTRQKLESASLLERANNHLRLISPVSYLEMIGLEANATAICTDSGGVQKEAFFFQCPCITLRDETEWTELVTGGFNQVVGADPDAIVEAFEASLVAKPNWSTPLYGEGNAAGLIAKSLG